MNLYLLKQNANRGYDTYDSAVVAAETEDAARATHPDGQWDDRAIYGTWARRPEEVQVELLGEAKPLTKAGVICASFNAG